MLWIIRQTIRGQFGLLAECAEPLTCNCVLPPLALPQLHCRYLLTENSCIDMADENLLALAIAFEMEHELCSLDATGRPKARTVAYRIYALFSPKCTRVAGENLNIWAKLARISAHLPMHAHLHVFFRFILCMY